MSEQSDLDEIIEIIKQQRDELMVQLHLAQAEARDEWDGLEKKWDELRPKLEAMGHEAGLSAKDVGAAASLLADEIRRGYERMRKFL